jgi:hypothetical protein
MTVFWYRPLWHSGHEMLTFWQNCCHVTGVPTHVITEGVPRAAVSGQATQLAATTAICSLYDTHVPTHRRRAQCMRAAGMWC